MSSLLFFLKSELLYHYKELIELHRKRLSWFNTLQFDISLYNTWNISLNYVYSFFWPLIVNLIHAQNHARDRLIQLLRVNKRSTHMMIFMWNQFCFYFNNFIVLIWIFSTNVFCSYSEKNIKRSITSVSITEFWLKGKSREKIKGLFIL